MQDFVEVTGIVLKAVPVLEMDKRITVLTKERGKISAFARGAKKPGSRFMAATNPFCYGTFRLYEGKRHITCPRYGSRSILKTSGKILKGLFTVCISVMWQIIIQGKITMKKRC